MVHAALTQLDGCSHFILAEMDVTFRTTQLAGFLEILQWILADRALLLGFAATGSDGLPHVPMDVVEQPQELESI